MKKYSLVIALVLASTGHYANAALVTGDVLAFDPGAAGGVGSYFGMDVDASGTFSNSEKFAISMFEGIRIGTIQSASGSHSGLPDGSEMPSIDNPWAFSGQTGMHSTTSAVTEVSPGVLDFSGWMVNWNGFAIAMGGDALKGDTGLASIICTPAPCATGNSFVLDYFAHVQQSDPSAKGGILYTLHLEGQISAVPVPAAVWLFASGLLGLTGMAFRRKVSS
jgi:hypothetical protein